MRNSVLILLKSSALATGMAVSAFMFTSAPVKAADCDTFNGQSIAQVLGGGASNSCTQQDKVYTFFDSGTTNNAIWRDSTFTFNLDLNTPTLGRDTHTFNLNRVGTQTAIGDYSLAYSMEIDGSNPANDNKFFDAVGIGLDVPENNPAVTGEKLVQTGSFGGTTLGDLTVDTGVISPEITIAGHVKKLFITDTIHQKTLAAQYSSLTNIYIQRDENIVNTPEPSSIVGLLVFGGLGLGLKRRKKS